MRSPALVVPTGCSTTPMLDVMSSSWSPTWNGVDRLACTFSASSITSAMEVVSSRRITNSSPPIRATVLRAAPLQAGGDADQQLVAVVVAERVVHRLETVEVQVAQPDALSRRAREDRVEALGEQ